jgi:hypothetical protein
VIRALQAGAEVSFGLLTDARAAMAADIIEGPHLSLPVAQDDQALVERVQQEVVAGVGDAALVPGTQPVTFEDAPDLALERFLRGVAMLRQRQRTGSEVFFGLEECAGHRSLLLLK